LKLTLPPGREEIIRDLRSEGYRALIVGGAVRDALLGLEPKDFDIEVYGISYDKLAEFLKRYGPVDLVGKSFGVIKLFGTDMDFSIPRRESKTGSHHRDFRTEFDESITPQEAASRRDFTINAMSWDPLTGGVVDFFGGQDDLKHRILRATSPSFREDSLRVLRGMQFACRFDLRLDPHTAQECQALVDEYSTLAKERIADEFYKWAVKSTKPSRLIEYLNDSGWIAHFPEVRALQGVPQDPDWHPEGDVAIHTMLVVNEAVRIADDAKLTGDARAVLLFAALCHDFAKATTTEKRIRDGKLRWSSFGHEEAGGPMAREFLERIGIKAAIVEQVVPLVENHLAHASVGKEVTPRAVRRLAMRLAPATIEQLIRLIDADASGRPPRPKGLPPGALKILQAAHDQSVVTRPQSPLILGRHVLPYFDNQPGPHIGKVVAAAYEAQADGVFSNEEEASAWLKDYISQLSAQRKL
jgi:tRNA nucleotidyltransferase (CCA-adding enzyme)